MVTTDCGRYRFERSGRLRFAGRAVLPVPAGVSWYPDLTWHRVSSGHLTIGHGQRTLWRSRARFRDAYSIGAVVRGRAAIAFSTFHRRPQSMFVARYGQAERAVAIGETPLGFTRGGALVSQQGSRLVLRRGSTWYPRRLASGVSHVVFDHATRSLVFVAQGRLERFDGVRIKLLARLASLRVGRRPQIEPLGKLVGLHDAQRLIVLREDGSVFASTRLPRPLKRGDFASSALAADARGRTVAFTFTRGNTAYGSRGSELVYLLGSGATAARVVYRERLSFAVCERMASLSWRGDWLLYSASEGRAAAIDTRRPSRSIDLSGTIARLPGFGGNEGRFDVGWA